MSLLILKDVLENIYASPFERYYFFIGILTKGKPIMTGRSVFRGKHLLFVKITNWLASYWIIQESGYAIGRGKKVTFLIENGLELPGGLNADFQYVSVDRNNLSDTIIKVTQIISNEIATRITALGIPVVSKGTELIPSQKAEIQEPEVIEEDEYAFGVVMEAIIKKDFAAANEKFNLFLQDVKSSPGKIRKNTLLQETLLSWST
jgi:hypothetical protein